MFTRLLKGQCSRDSTLELSSELKPSKMQLPDDEWEYEYDVEDNEVGEVM